MPWIKSITFESLQENRLKVDQEWADQTEAGVRMVHWEKGPGIMMKWFSDESCLKMEVNASTSFAQV